MPPLVSVVIPSYNHARYLPEAIASVLSQRDVALELIIIDDGSRDESWALIEQAARQDSRIRAHRQENQGAHAAISRGLALGEGRFLTILNSDDRYSPGRLATLAALADAGEGLDFIATGLTLIDEAGARIPDHPWLDEYRRMVAGAHRTGLWPALLERNFTVSTSNFFLRRSLWQALGPLRPLRYNMDWDFALRAWEHDPARFAWRDDLVLWEYRLHGHNTILGGLPTSAIEANHLLYGVMRRHYGVPGTALAGLRRHHRLIRHQQVARIAHARDTEWDARLQAALDQVREAHAGWARTRDAHEAALAQLAALQASRSYRLGRALTAPARWLRQRRPARAAGIPTPPPAAGALPAYREIALPAPLQGPVPRVAVHLHLHYPDLADELMREILHLPQPFDLFVTTTRPAGELRARIQADCPDARVWETPNQGKDIGPFVDALVRYRLDRYDLVLKLHGKKSRNQPGYLQVIRQLFGPDIQDGDDWRRKLIRPLAGSRDRVLRIYRAFAEDPGIGAAGAARFICTAPDADAAAYNALCRRLGIPDGVRFFAGTMFWIRGSALTPMLDAGMTQADFGVAPQGQVEGSLEHACERVFGPLATAGGRYLAGLADLNI